MFAAIKACKADCVVFSAIILPAGHDPKRDWELWEYWVARITDIRAIVHDENSNSVRVSPSFIERFTLILPCPVLSLSFVGLGTRSMVLLGQRCVKHHKILVRRQTRSRSSILIWLCVVSNRKSFGKHERAFSDHFDFVQPESFDGNVYPFKGCPNTYSF